MIDLFTICFFIQRFIFYMFQKVNILTFNDNTLPLRHSKYPHSPSYSKGFFTHKNKADNTLAIGTLKQSLLPKQSYSISEVQNTLKHLPLHHSRHDELPGGLTQILLQDIQASDWSTLVPS